MLRLVSSKRRLPSLSVNKILLTRLLLYLCSLNEGMWRYERGRSFCQRFLLDVVIVNLVFCFNGIYITEGSIVTRFTIEKILRLISLILIPLKVFSRWKSWIIIVCMFQNKCNTCCALRTVFHEKPRGSGIYKDWFESRYSSKIRTRLALGPLLISSHKFSKVFLFQLQCKFSYYLLETYSIYSLIYMYWCIARECDTVNCQCWNRYDSWQPKSLRSWHSSLISWYDLGLLTGHSFVFWKGRSSLGFNIITLLTLTTHKSYSQFVTEDGWQNGLKHMNYEEKEKKF